MSKSVPAVLGGLVVFVLAVVVFSQHRSEAQLRAESEALRQQLQQLARVSAENQRLSNLVAEARVAQGTANEQLQELLKLRAEVARSTQAPPPSNSVQDLKLPPNVAEPLRQITALRGDMSQLSDLINKLREELRQGVAPAPVASAPAAAEPAPAADNSTASLSGNRLNSASSEQQPLSIRIIPTQSETFAEKLKRTVNAQENESFQDVFSRFLQLNGIETDRIAGMVFDDRTGRVIVRGPAPLLDAIERITLALDRAQ